MIFVDLSSFKSTVGVGNFKVWLHASGVKPSRTVSLGCVANVAGSNGGKQASWNTDGSVSLVGGVSPNDTIHCYQKVIPVPADVTFS